MLIAETMNNVYTGHTPFESWEHTRVYSADIEHDSKRLAVACKFAYDLNKLEALRAEATHYNDNLRTLQGQYISIFLGLYTGKAESGGIGHMGCLMMSYCGERLQLTDCNETQSLADIM